MMLVDDDRSYRFGTIISKLSLPFCSILHTILMLYPSRSRSPSFYILTYKHVCTLHSIDVPGLSILPQAQCIMIPGDLNVWCQSCHLRQR